MERSLAPPRRHEPKTAFDCFAKRGPWVAHPPQALAANGKFVTTTANGWPSTEIASTSKYITFIFLDPLNGIDFIRRFGECCSCWVVDDIGATFDLTAINDFLAGGA
jgi:hypothetical protein